MQQGEEQQLWAYMSKDSQGEYRVVNLLESHHKVPLVSTNLDFLMNLKTWVQKEAAKRNSPIDLVKFTSRQLVLSFNP